MESPHPLDRFDISPELQTSTTYLSKRFEKNSVSTPDAKPSTTPPDAPVCPRRTFSIRDVMNGEEESPLLHEQIMATFPSKLPCEDELRCIHYQNLRFLISLWKKNKYLSETEKVAMSYMDQCLEGLEEEM
jgi:hypothetical protein